MTMIQLSATRTLCPTQGHERDRGREGEGGRGRESERGYRIYSAKQNVHTNLLPSIYTHTLTHTHMFLHCVATLLTLMDFIVRIVTRVFIILSSLHSQQARDPNQRPPPPLPHLNNHTSTAPDPNQQAVKCSDHLDTISEAPASHPLLKIIRDHIH